MLLFPWRTYYHCLQGDCCYSLAMGKGEYYYFFKGGSTTIPFEGVLLCPCIGKSIIPCKGSIIIYANHGECYYPILRNITTDSKGNTAISLQWEKSEYYYSFRSNVLSPLREHHYSLQENITTPIECDKENSTIPSKGLPFSLRE